MITMDIQRHTADNYATISPDEGPVQDSSLNRHEIGKERCLR